MVADFFVEILAGTTEMLAALGTALTDALALIYTGGAVQPIGQLILAIGGIGLAYSAFNFFVNLVKSIGARASRGKK